MIHSSRPKRPKNLDLFTIHFPLPAIVSILHRIAGVILFFLIPFVLWGLDISLTPTGFDTMQQWLSNFYVKFIFLIIFIPFCYHLVAGIRHLLLDIGVGDTLKGGKRSSQLTLLISAILIIWVGIWLW